ncbi:MAG: hypothetical protein ACREBU_06670 [Nitrososphaera sp.]
MILHKRTQLENTRSIRESERLFTELEALEWLQRQVVKYIQAPAAQDVTRG